MSKSSGSKAVKAKAPAKKPVASAGAKGSPAPAKKVAVAKNLKAVRQAALQPANTKTVAVKKPPAKKVAPVKAPEAKTQAKHAVADRSQPARTIATAKAAPAKKSEGLKSKMAARVKIADIVLPPGYKPSETEPFMNDMHRAYFRKRLIEWKDEILRQTRETLAILHEDSAQHADLADRATSETDRATELRTRDRQRKLIAKIDAALARIEDGTYGYCEDTGEPIGLKRLDARPIATLSVEAQERHERRERVYREE